MIKSRKDLNFYLREDNKRNGLGGSYIRYKLNLLGGAENAYALKYLRLLRFSEFYYNNSSNLVYKLLFYWYKMRLNHLGVKLHIRIPLNTCGYGLRLMHLSGGGGLLLNVNRLGNYCGFNAGVLLGNNNAKDARPTIGNYVAFGPGAKAFGKIEIGDNVFVAPNAVVTKSVPSNSIVGGIPAKVLKEKRLEENKVYAQYHKE